MIWNEHTYRVAGQSFAVRSTSPDFLREFRRIFRAFPCQPGPATGKQHFEVEAGEEFRIRKGRRFLFRCPGIDDAVEFLEAELYAQLVRLLDRRLVFHAAAAVRQETLLLLPAASGGGKTTLAAGLVKRGCLYLTDEMLILNPATLRPAPFPKPLNLKHGSLALFPRLGPELRRARRGPLSEPRRRIHHMLVRPRYRQRRRPETGRVAIVFPAFQRGASVRLDPLERVEAVRRLAASCYNHYRFGARFVSCAERLTRGALCAELRYGDLAGALDLIDRQVVALAAPEETPAPAL